MNQKTVKKAPFLTLTQQLQIAISNTMAGRQTTPDSSNDIASMVNKKGSLYSMEVEAEACTH